jgi:hypothetical protein
MQRMKKTTKTKATALRVITRRLAMVWEEIGEMYAASGGRALVTDDRFAERYWALVRREGNLLRVKRDLAGGAL